jgi:putative phosphoribosyl transferase
MWISRRQPTKRFVRFSNGPIACCQQNESEDTNLGKEVVMNRTSGQSSEERLVQIFIDSVTLEGNLGIPEGAEGIVLFAHGSGSSRFSPRNRFVAKVLREGGLATLLMDLLTSEEEEVDRLTRHLRFDIELLAKRLVGATDWLLQHPDTQGLHIGHFGSSTGAAAALIAATRRPGVVDAIVSRGGRPDLAGPVLSQVEAPTLLIVGGDDVPVIGLNREALAQLRTEKKLEIISGATHLFEEPGALEEVAQLARQWFQRYLTSVEV